MQTARAGRARAVLSAQVRPQARVASMALQASSRPFTALTDLSNIACSSAFSLMSTIFSMPSLPMMVGTPTYIPSRPKAPET